MVLDALGQKLDGIFRKIRGLPTIDKEAIGVLLQELQRSLLMADVKVELVFALTEKIKKAAFDQKINIQIKRKDYIIKILHDELIHLLGGKSAPTRIKKGKTSVILLIGIQGSGKTTTIGKLAKFYSKKGFKLGVICTDTWRPGAFDQLKQNIEKIGQANIDVFGQPNEKNAIKIAKKGMKLFTGGKERKDLIIVDTAGRHKEENDLMKEMVKLEKIIKPNETILVIDGTLGQQAYAQADAFAKTTNVGSIVITKLDGSAKGGGALSAAVACGAPVSFIGIGERTDDLEEFDPTGFVGELLGIPDLKGLVEKVEELGIEPDEDQVKRMMRGKFTLEDLYQQLKSFKKLGPFSKIMAKMGGKNLPGELKGMAEQNLDKWQYVLDSCTQEEKDEPKLIKKNRIRRIAHGSGSTYTEIKQMLKQYEQMKKMMKGMMGKGMKQRGRGKKGQEIPGMDGVPGMGGLGGFDMGQLSQMMQGQQQAGKKRKKHPW